MDATIQTYSTGRYGLVDLHYRHIWLNHWSEDIAHEIRRAFWNKATVAVFDLAWFDNYNDETVDSKVSLNWKIPVSQNLKSRVLHTSLKNDVLFATQTEHESESKLLLNEPTRCNLSVDQQHELQNQMLLLMSVLEYTHLVDPEFREPEREQLLLDIRRVFLTEINTDVIRERLCEVASSYISGPDNASVKILRLLGKLYA